MPTAARPVPQGGTSFRVIFPKGHAIQRLIRYNFNTFYSKIRPSLSLNDTFSQQRHSELASNGFG